jgi:hypothetical protein
MSSLQDLVNAAIAERLEADYRAARADAFKAAAVGEAERQRAAGVPVRELSSDQRLGALRLDAADLPAAPIVTKPEEFSSWLAEHAPALVAGLIRVPADRLEEALEALGYAGLSGPTVSAAVVPKDSEETARWLKDNTVVQADPQVSRAWNVLHRDEEGHLTPVPGTSAVQPVPQWKVIVDKDRKSGATEVARTEVEGQVAELRRIAGAEARVLAGGTTPEELAADLADAAVEDGV